MRRVLGWLTRLFGKRAPAESAAPPVATVDLSSGSRPQSAGSEAVAAGRQATPSPTAAPAGTAPALAEPREVCPTCGKTSVFAGPPGHRYCMHCALREELFDASAAARH